MVLYTIVSLETIFEETMMAEFLNSAGTEEFEIDLSGKKLVVQLLSSGQLQINRLISTNPSDYLNPDWQPGSIL